MIDSRQLLHLKKNYLLLLSLFLLTQLSVAQSSVNYLFSTNNNGSLALDMNGNTVDMTTGTTLLIGAGLNSVASASMNIGFDFWFMGSRNTTFNATSHGLIGLTTSVSTGNNVGGGAGPRIGAFVNGTTGTNMATSSTGKVHYKIVGTAPNRTLVVEWLNMSINSSSTNADATFQVRLYESSYAIELMYGTMNITTGGPFTTIRAGFSSNSSANTFSTINFITHTTTTAAGTDNTLSNGVVTALNSAANGSRRFYRFVPAATVAPSGINFTSVSASSMTVNWTDNASDEAGYAVFRSDDGGSTYNFQAVTSANATTFTTIGLLANTNYFWRVYAIRESLSTVLQGNQTTLATTAVSSVGSGLWSLPATWSTGIVPSTSDAVTIGAGHTVTIDVTGFAYSLFIDGILEFEQTTARGITIGESVTINATGTLRSNLAGTVTTHTITIGKNLTNNGTLDFSTNTNTAGAGIVFNTALNGAFSLGPSTTTNVRTINMNKGTSQSPLMVFTPNGSFTVLGANTTGFLNFGTGGTFEIGGSNSFINPVFTAAAYTIPATTGFRLNNPNAEVVSQNGSPTLSGLLRVSQGTFNIGTATGNSMGFNGGSTVIIDGGFVNATGRFGVASATNVITYTQTGGTITVNTIGHASTTVASFDLGTSLLSIVNISGGSIILQTASTAASGPRDYRVQAGQGIGSFSGGTLQIGNALSGAAKTFNIMGVANNLIVTSTSGNHTCIYGSSVTYNNTSRNITIQTGATLNLGASLFIMAGATLTNNGILNGSTTGARLYWLGVGGVPQTYTGIGTVTPLLQSFEVDNGLGVTIDPTVANIQVARINMFSGNITNTDKLTLGNGGTSSGIIQYGNATTPTAAGNFDVSPTFNIGSGGLNIFYLRENNARSTGFEINPTRTLNNITIDNNINALTVAGGTISVGGTLNLTNGKVNTSVTNLITVTNTTAAAVVGGNANSYINGPFERTLPASLASGSNYNFPIGKSTYTAFEMVNPTTNAGGTVVIRAESFDGSSNGTPGIGMSSLNSNRYWQASFTSGVSNYTNGTIRLTETVLGLAGGNRIGQSATVNGTYNNIGNIVSGLTLTSTTTIATLGFFNIGLTDQIITGGSFNVGNSAPTYQKLTQVAAALNSGVVTGNLVFELQADYDGTIGETFPINFVPISKSGGNWKISIRPKSGVAGRITSGDPGTGNPLIVLNGVDSISIDGRPNGLGTNSEWTFRNIRTAATVGSVFVFQNGATVDTLQYLKIEGQNTAVGQASVLFSTTTLPIGNSNNVLRGNDIRDRSDATGVPHSLVGSSGTTGAPNNNNKLIGNTLRNFTSNGIAVSSNSNNWIIGGTTVGEGNNIYQEAQRTTAISHINITTGDNHLIGYNNIYQTAGIPNTAGMNCINVTGGGNGHIIRNNSIGGSNASRTGNALTINFGSTINGILVGAGTASTTHVHNNIISNFGNRFSSSTLGIANGIIVNGGTVNVGTLGGNTIGGAVVTSVASDTLISMYDNGWINLQGGSCIVENNLITNGSYYRQANDRHAGITVGAGSNHILRNNTIRALRGNNQIALPSAFTLAGIFCSISGTIIENNTIDDIQNFNTNAAFTTGPSSLGINWTAGVSGIINRNRITNVRATGSFTGLGAPFTYGIYFSNGNPVISNNQIAIGSSSGNETRVAGIVSSGSTNPGALIAYNSIYINGANSSGTNNSYGLLRTGTSNNTYFNNILFNERTGGTGRHYAIGNTAALPATNFTAASANHNLYIASNATSVGEWGAGVNRDFAQWKSSSLADTISYSVTNSTVSASSLFVNPAIGNLNINTSNAACWYANGKGIAGIKSGLITNDYVGEARGTTLGIPTDIGSDEFTPGSGVIPPLSSASAAPANSTTTTYSFGGRKIGEITWGAAGTVPTNIDHRYYSGNQGPGVPSIAAYSYSDVVATGGSGYDYAKKLYYTEAEKNNLSDATLQQFKYDSPGPWLLIGGTQATDVDGKYITVSGLTNFSLFSLSAPLPCQLNVVSAINAGSGTLRDAIGCAVTGSTITIDPSVSMIALTSPLSILGKTLTIQDADMAPVMITLDSDVSDISVSASGTAIFDNLHIKDLSATKTNAVLNNNGTLTLKNTKVSGDAGSMNSPTVKNNGVGNVNVDGATIISNQ